MPNSAPITTSVVPATGDTGGAFEVHEYPLIEQSSDNPNHVEFQARVPLAVAARRTGWPFQQAEDAIQAQNQALGTFGYRIESNPTPPFSGYALFHNSALIQRDIAKFWPVSLQRGQDNEGWDGFLLFFETLDGEKLVASLEGIRPWPGQEQSAGGVPPIDYDDRVAYAESVGSEVNVYAGAELLSGSDGDDGVFGWQVVAGEPFYFFHRGGLIHINFAGRDLAYTYDQVVHDNTGETAIFNPGGTGQVAWFYALRDGVWHYVEIGVFGQSD